jgi:RNA polymerase sigma factor (sigma-70 family)
MKEQELIPHLFRTEYRKIVSVLCKRFGMEQLALAEDIASDTFLAAVQTWPYNGLPANPVAWLYTVAKNKTHNQLQRRQLFSGTIAPAIAAGTQQCTEAELDLSPQNILDSQLQMMFAICHPCIPPTAQVGLALRLLCGFGIEEIADAFLSNPATISKRLLRAREKLRAENIAIAFPPASGIHQRIENVLTTLYLLFNEGYYSESNEAVLREDLCAEAIRLTKLLLLNHQTGMPAVKALLALMYFHASRFNARRNSSGTMVFYDDQDETRWNLEMISTGASLLKEAATGEQLSRYHIEASIAYWHTQKNDTPEKWNSIVTLYNQLLDLAWSPMAALNRAYAVFKTGQRQLAIRDALALQLTGNHFYCALLGELYTGHNNSLAKEYFETGFALAKTTTDKTWMQTKINNIAPD